MWGVFLTGVLLGGFGLAFALGLLAGQEEEQDQISDMIRKEEEKARRIIAELEDEQKNRKSGKDGSKGV